MILRHLPSLSAKVYIGEGGVNVELIVVILLVAVFYGGIAFLIWKNRRQRATSAERPSEPREAASPEVVDDMPVSRRRRGNRAAR